MKYHFLFLFAVVTSFFACKDNLTDDMNPDGTVYIEDNIFGCDQFEVMETNATFVVNVEPCLEVFNQFFVYEDSDSLVIKDGFNGPTLQTYDMEVEDLVIFNNHLMICAEEGLYSLNASGEMNTITEERCYSMTLDGQNRLMLQGIFGNPNLGSTYAIYEFKNSTLVPFTSLPSSFMCVSLELIGGSEQSLYAISCDNDIAHYENGVLNDELLLGEAPLFTTNGELIRHQYYDGGLIAITLDNFDAYRVYKHTAQGWKSIYDLAYVNEKTEKSREVFAFVDNNILIYNDFLYTFGVGGEQDRRGIGRFDISGDEQKSYEDIDLIEIPGLKSRDIVDIILASDGSAYAVMKSRMIVKMTCQ